MTSVRLRGLVDNFQRLLTPSRQPGDDLVEPN